MSHRGSPRRSSNPVDELVFQCKAAGLPEPQREARFHPTRRWRFDLSWDTYVPSRMRHVRVACEVDGGVHTGGRHVRGAGYERDCEKLNAAAIYNWSVIRVTPRHVKSGQALAWLEQLLK